MDESHDRHGPERHSKEVARPVAFRAGLRYSLAMRLATRVFLATSAVGATGVLVATSLAYLSAESLHRRQYHALYQERLEMAARDFRAIEQAYDQLALNAAHVAAERLARQSLSTGLSASRLAALAQELGVSRIAVADRRGNVVAASTPASRSNLFTACPRYRGLLDGSLGAQSTPLLPESADAAGGAIASRHTLVALPARAGRQARGLIDVSVRSSDLGVMLQQLADDEGDLDYVALRGPEGRLLGEARNRNRDTSRLSLDGPAAPGDRLSATVVADEAECCECVARGLVKPGARYAYELIGILEPRTLNGALADLRARFGVVLAAVLAFALLVSAWASRALTTRVRALRDAIDAMVRSRDYSTPLEGSGQSDEIGALAHHFNTLASEMRDAQRAEARAAVAAQVSHDIRSPLTAMMLAFNQLQTLVNAEERLRGPTAGLLSALSNGLSRVSGIINRLMARPSANANGTGPANTDGAAAVEKPRLILVDKLLLDVAQEHALKLPRAITLSVTGFAPVPEVWAVVQATELQAALSNVLTNACEAVGSGGRVELACRREGGELLVSVRDDGAGIPTETLARVFERAFTSGKVGGSGLGLYQAKRAVEWCGGRIAIESAVGRGTTVTFGLPTEKTPAMTVDVIALAAGETLVVADDDPAVLAAWREKARAAGLGENALAAFSSIPDLSAALPGLGEVARLRFVLDQHAPGADGDERGGMTGLKFIEEHKLGERAVLCTSEYDDPTIQDRVKAARARLLPKPRLAAASVIVGELNAWTS